MSLLRSFRIRGPGTTSGDALWNAMAAAAGVVFAKRFDSSVDIPALSQPSTQTSFVLADGQQSRVSIDSVTVQPGASGSLKFDVLNTDLAGSGIVSCYFGGTRTFAAGDTAWFSYLVRAPIEHVFAQWALGFGPAHKLSIFSAGPNPSNPSVGSNEPNEVVVQSNDNRGILSGYAQDGVGGYNPPDLAWSSACSSTDHRTQPIIDHGANPLTGNDPDTGSTWSACAQDRARYGGLHGSETLEFYGKGIGDPLDGAYRQKPDVWIRVTSRLIVGTAFTANSRWTMWAAEQGSPYTLIHDKSDVVLGGPPPAYDTLWLLPYCSQRSAGGRSVSATSGTIGGVSVPLCGVGNALGSGSLEYTASSGLFRYHSSNDSYGASHGFSVANGITRINLKGSKEAVATTTTGSVTLPASSIALTDASAFPASGTAVIGTPDTSNPGASGGVGEQRVEYTGKSGNTLTGCTGGTGTHNAGSPAQVGSSIMLRLDNAAALPTSGVTTMTVTIADGRPATAVRYGDVIVSTQAIKTRDGFSPVDTGTPLQTFAASLTSGQWAQMSPTPSGLGKFTHATGSSGLKTGYSDKYVRDATSKKQYFLGCDHGDPVSFLSYDESANAWDYEAASVPWGIAVGGTTSHGYEHTVWDDVHGKLYHRPYGTLALRRWEGGTTWSTFSYGPPAYYSAASVGVCWFPDYGTNGTILIYQLENTPYGALFGFDPVTQVFSTIISQSSHTLTPAGDPSTFAHYSPQKQVVWFGGGYGSTKSWVLDKTGTLTSAPAFPTAMTTQDTVMVGPSNVGATPVCNPVNGNFMLIQGPSNWWDFDPIALTFTARTGTASMYSTNLAISTDPAYASILVPIPEYGVIAAVKTYGAGSADGEMWVFKP